MTRRTLLAERRTLSGLDGSAENIARTAKRRLLGVNAGDVEALFGVEVAVVSVETPATLRNDADAAPGAIGDFKNFFQKLLRGAIAVEGDDAAVSVLHFVTAAFELTTARRMPSSRSSGSKPVTTMGTPNFSASGGYSQ